MQEEAKHKEETAKIEAQLRAEATRIETELARRKLELGQLEVKKQIEIARAKLAAYQEVEDSEDDFQGGLAATFDLAAFGLYMIAPVKKSVNHSKTVTSMREVQRSLARTRICFFVRGDSIVEKEFVFCYCLFAVSIFGDSTGFGHHISLNSGSVYTPAVYYVKNMSVMVVLSKT